LSGPWQKHHDHVRLPVRLTPNGGRDAIDGVEQDADGNAHLKIRISAVPEGGKANKALIVLLAKKLGLPKSSITFISGETARKKSSGSIPTRRISKSFLKICRHRPDAYTKLSADQPCAL